MQPLGVDVSGTGRGAKSQAKTEEIEAETQGFFHAGASLTCLPPPPPRGIWETNMGNHTRLRAQFLGLFFRPRSAPKSRAIPTSPRARLSLNSQAVWARNQTRHGSRLIRRKRGVPRPSKAPHALLGRVGLPLVLLLLADAVSDLTNPSVPEDVNGNRRERDGS
jgi:hypothetical protein